MPHSVSDRHQDRPSTLTSLRRSEDTRIPLLTPVSGKSPLYQALVRMNSTGRPLEQTARGIRGTSQGRLAFRARARKQGPGSELLNTKWTRRMADITNTGGVAKRTPQTRGVKALTYEVRTDNQCMITRYFTRQHKITVIQEHQLCRERTPKQSTTISRRRTENTVY